ncbi:MAG TPA: hypothetical protein VL120_09735 [Solirubrobacteraceae bacterium]|jgi:hypothetical protein|nr:hypothetical protein [Solirubrobacteraceae bacterium]
MRRLRPTDTVQTAAFAVPAGAAEPAFAAADGGAERLRCASVLKAPLLWAAAGLAPYAGAPADWERLAREAVTVSANAPTVEVWDACGGEALLGALAARTAARLELEREPGSPRSFGRVLVGAQDVARAYAALALSDDGAARRVRGWMLEVPARQTFGVRAPVARGLGVDAASVGVKAGWFCDSDEERIRTHVVTVTATGAGVVGTVVLTALGAGAAARRAYSAAYRYGDEVLGVHEQHAGAVVRAATERALAAARTLLAA